MSENEENMWKSCVQHIPLSLALWPFQTRKTHYEAAVSEA